MSSWPLSSLAQAWLGNQVLTEQYGKEIISIVESDSNAKLAPFSLNASWMRCCHAAPSSISDTVRWNWNQSNVVNLSTIFEPARMHANSIS
ncbi:hypothetical protein DCAR_0416658 [Daucus carota subsp. sativus]|uniref:Uncharacterized protein n=1 Tax=Daucus carota subsp. sativus TaxID=79200 RepID=A0A165XNY8_DAUCS|nr:hypothetical protein DCAR_0416658 [Daucus carota subsp. sativus]